MKLTTKPTGLHYITDIGTVLSTKPDQGKRDSLGRTAMAMMVYENGDEMLIGVLNYFSGGVCMRYPNEKEINSRDHAVIASSCVKQRYNYPIHPFNKPFITVPRFTLGQRIWLKAMFSKSWSIVYLIYKLPGLAIIYPLWNWILRAISGTLETYENPADWKYNRNYFNTNKPPTQWQKFCFRLTLKTFASMYTLYEINALESDWAKRILRKVMILHFEESNYVARAMCGTHVKYPENYIPSRSNRWWVRLDRTCDRDMTPYNDTEEDNVEMGMLRFCCG
jgi:hypothetical protein